MDGHGIVRMHENHAHWLQVEIKALRRELTSQSEEIESPRQDHAALQAQNPKLKQRIDELTGKASSAARQIPAFVKSNVPDDPRRKRVTPYWRTVRYDGSLHEKFPGGTRAQAARLRAEGLRISAGRRACNEPKTQGGAGVSPAVHDWRAGRPPHPQLIHTLGGPYAV